MIEKRKSQRIPFHLAFNICDLYKQDTAGIHQLSSPIELTDISEHGVGFTSECILPLDYHFHATLKTSDETEFSAVLHIIRCAVLDRNRYGYGCEFVSLDEAVRELIRQYVADNL